MVIVDNINITKQDDDKSGYGCALSLEMGLAKTRTVLLSPEILGLDRRDDNFNGEAFPTR